MSSKPDERLAKVENMLEDHVEGQRISKFDNAMFLAQPLVILGVGWLGNALQHAESLRYVAVMGLTFAQILTAFSYFLAFGLIWGFVRFLRSYFSDDLRGRILACHALVSGFGLMVIQLLYALVWINFTDLDAVVSPQILSAILPHAAALCVVFAATILWDGLAARFALTVALWLERNALLAEPKERIDLPLSCTLPGRLWLDARTSFLCGQYIASILLTSLSLEIAVRQALRDRLEKEALDVSGLDELDFRNIVGQCKDFTLFGPRDTDIYGHLHRCYDIRRNYSHGKLPAILGQMGKSPVFENVGGAVIRAGAFKDVPYLALLGMRGAIAKEDALRIMALVADAFEVFYPIRYPRP